MRGGRREEEERGKTRGIILIPDFCVYIQLLSMHTHTQAYTTTHLSRMARRGAGLAIWAASLDNLIISHTACEAFPHC